MLGRLLQRLEQGVERLARQHVHFIDDVDLVARPAGTRPHGLANLADFINAAIARCVHLDDVHVLAGSNALANLALVAGCRRRPMHTVERLGQNARRGRFAHAARTYKQVSMCQSVLCHRIFESLRDMGLADKIVKGLGPIFSREDFVAHK